MRKIWWLPVICIAACVAQALIAADPQGSATRKNSAGGRARLLIYSRNKAAEPGPEQDQEEEAAPPARTRVPRPASERVASEEAAKPTPRKPVPSGVTGAISPKSAALKSAARGNPGKTRLAADVSAEPNTEEAVTDIDDEEIRQMFEDETSPTPRQVQRSIPRKPTARSGVSDSASRTGLSDVEPLDPSVRKAARYQELLGSPTTDASSPAPSTKQKIQPVSSGASDKADLEINPFEASERPTPVVNAGWEEEQGALASKRIKQASATAASKPAASDRGEKSATGKAASARPAAVKNVSVDTTFEVSKGKEPVKTDSSKIVAKSIPTKESFEAPTAKPVLVAGAAGAGNHTPQVDVQWEARGEVTLGQECQCVLVVHNRGKVAAREIIVEANFPESVKLVDAKPFPKETSQRLEWQFESLDAGEKRVIELTMVPTKRGELGASAQVRFTGTAATSFQVSEPLLTASLKLPDEVHLGDPASAIVTVSNPGTGTAQNVVVEATLPPGLSSSTGSKVVTELGPLGAGETRTMRLALIASAGGDQTVRVVARSSTAELAHTATAKVVVLAPSLVLKASGPSLRYVNRTAKYLLTVTNNSNADSENVRIVQNVPAGFDFVKADHGGSWESQRRVVSWYLGHLDAGQATTVELELMPKDTGEFTQQFRVMGDAGAEATAQVATRVEGAASLVMVVKDGDDPVEVGSETAFEVRVRNDGSKSARKVAVSLELPPDVDFVNVDGPTQHLFESGMLIFKPIEELAAGDSATYKVFIKGTASGTTKLRARLTSESIQKPLIVEEATQFYEE